MRARGLEALAWETLLFFGFCSVTWGVQGLAFFFALQILGFGKFGFCVRLLEYDVYWGLTVKGFKGLRFRRA